MDNSHSPRMLRICTGSTTEPFASSEVYHLLGLDAFDHYFLVALLNIFNISILPDWRSPSSIGNCGGSRLQNAWERVRISRTLATVIYDVTIDELKLLPIMDLNHKDWGNRTAIHHLKADFTEPVKGRCGDGNHISWVVIVFSFSWISARNQAQGRPQAVSNTNTRYGRGWARRLDVPPETHTASLCMYFHFSKNTTLMLEVPRRRASPICRLKLRISQHSKLKNKYHFDYSPTNCSWSSTQARSMRNSACAGTWNLSLLGKRGFEFIFVFSLVGQQMSFKAAAPNHFKPLPKQICVMEDRMLDVPMKSNVHTSSPLLLFLSDMLKLPRRKASPISRLRISQLWLHTSKGWDFSKSWE